MTSTEAAPATQFAFSHDGACPICEKPVTFTANGPYFRATLRCPGCQSIPRERALMAVLAKLYPNWRAKTIHESSPVGRGASLKLQRECGNYVASQYDPAIPWGERHPSFGYRSEDLEAQSFADASFDLVITQDVFEHLFHPDRAIAEIACTLKPRGSHICTFPIVRRSNPSARRASLRDGSVIHHQEPEYHGNPMSGDGSLVTVDWGYDVAGYLAHHSGLTVTIHAIDDIDRGIRADLNEVIVCTKTGPADLAI